MVLRPAMVERLLTKSVPAMVCAFLLVGCAFSPESTTPASLRSLIDEESALAIETPIENDSTQAVQEDAHATATPDSEEDVPEVEPEITVVEITTDVMVIPPSVEQLLPKSFSLEGTGFGIRLNEGKTQADLDNLFREWFSYFLCDTYSVNDCNLDVLAEKIGNDTSIPLRNGNLVVFDESNNSYHTVQEGPNFPVTFGDENGHLKVKIITYESLRDSIGLGFGFAGFAVRIDSSGRIAELILEDQRGRIDTAIVYPALAEYEVALLFLLATQYMMSDNPYSSTILNDIKASGINNAGNKMSAMAEALKENEVTILKKEALPESIILFEQ